MRFQCPFCSYVMIAEDSHRGYKVGCPSCGKNVLVPVGRFEDGCVVGDFVIRGKIGEGSIGAVYRAVQISLDRIVALKILSPEYTNAKGVNDFLREARAAAKLIHTNIVQALAVGEDDGTCYMAMTYINGETVKARLKRDGKFEVDEALHIVQQVAEALYYAWDEAGMIHRDVKPDNIMITDDGIVKLTDLGLAMQQTEWREDMEISGSPSYMSPEQFTGDKLDSRSDIYSLGVTLYQMISGILPFDGQTVKSVAKQHFEEEAVPLNKRDPKVPPKVAQFVSRMMAKNPEDRFKDLEELLHGIWNLRQKTAPDTSLVPDVHTISIKRLDYEMQNDLLEKKKAHGARRRSASSFLERLDYVKVALIAAPVVVLFAIALALFLGRGGNAESGKVVQSLDYYKRLCSDKTMDPQELVKEGDKILADLGPLANFEQSEAILRFKTLYAEAGRRKAEQDAARLEESLKEAQTRIVSLKKAIEAQLKQPGKNVVENERNALKAELDNANASIAKLNAELAQSKTAEKSLTDYIKRLHGENEAFWKGDFRVRVFSLLSQCRFKEAAATVAWEASKRGVLYKDFFAVYSRLIENMEKVQAAVSDSGTRFAGAPVDSDGKLVMISDAEIEYQDSASKLKRKPWAEASTQGLAAIIAKDFKNVASESELKAMIELLKGNPGAAVKADPKDRELAAMATASLLHGVYSVRIIAEADKRKADLIAQNLQRQFEASDSLSALLKAELKAALQR